MRKLNTSHPRTVSRREFIERTGTALAAGLLASSTTRPATAQDASPADSPGSHPNRSDSFVHLLRPPDRITVFTDEGSADLRSAGRGRWEYRTIQVTTETTDGGMRLLLVSPNASVKRLVLHWPANLTAWQKLLGDHWERSYGDLEWAPLSPTRVMPWYFMAYDGKRTHGHGVTTGTSSLCHWKTAPDGITLSADVRSGGVGVQLGDRSLEVCTILCRSGHDGESPFEATRAFCRQMCPKPRLASHRVYGTNDWYYTYGSNDSATEILKDAQFIVSMSPSGDNRPYTVLDAGWHVAGGSDEGPWDRGNNRFPSMSDLARDILKAGARPGIWIRPLAAAKNQPKAWRLRRDPKYLDPTIPEVRHLVATDIARLHTWGYELIKHDYTTFDLTGRWGFAMGSAFTDDGWVFANRKLTTAEVMLDLYRTIRKAAGDALLLGCNTVSHLSAGLFELNRIGDDVSGKEWDRTRKMGVNCLAFRAPQHDTFYAADADCLGLTQAEAVPWSKNRQWLDLLARSGTPLFVSVNRKAVGPEQEKALREAVAIAAKPQPVPLALDWMETRLPRRWRLMGQEVNYDWS